MMDKRVVREMIKFQEIGQSKPMNGVLHVYNNGGPRERYAVVNGTIYPVVNGVIEVTGPVTTR